MYRRYGDQVAFFMVYIREAHAADERPSPANRRQGIFIDQPTSYGQRTELAQQTCKKLQISLPALVDAMDNRVNEAYNAAPDRLTLVGRDGRIAFQGARGPRGFDPAALEKAIEHELARGKPKRGRSR